MGKNAVASSQNSHLHFAGRQTSMIERFSLRFFFFLSLFFFFFFIFFFFCSFRSSFHFSDSLFAHPTPPSLPSLFASRSGRRQWNRMQKWAKKNAKIANQRENHTQKKRESGRRSRFAYRAGFALLFLVTRYFLREKCSKRNKRTTKQQTNKQTKEKRPTKHSLFVDGPCIIDVPGRTFH